MFDSLERIIIVTGHYGSGKTNFSINLALDLQARGDDVVLVDLDIVNPYFRTADFEQLAKEKGLGMIKPVYANSNLDLPALTAELDAKLHSGETLVIDVGGDDAGAYALGRYSAKILGQAYSMLYVVNCFRYLTREPEEAAELLRDIEKASRVKATGIINNSNLSTETTVEELAKSVDYAQKTADICGLPLLSTAVHRQLYQKLDDQQGYYPVDIYVKTPWQV